MYEAPAVEIVELEAKVSLLAGSERIPGEEEEF